MSIDETRGNRAAARDLIEAPRTAPAKGVALIAAGIAIAIFIADTFVSYEIAVAVLYAAVVLMSVNLPQRHAIAIAASACAFLTILEFRDHARKGLHGGSRRSRRRQSRGNRDHGMARSAHPCGDRQPARARRSARSHARRGVRARYGRPHHLLEPGRGRNVPMEPGGRCRQGFRSGHEGGVPGAARRGHPSELLRSGRWEGELVHKRRNGEADYGRKPLVVATRWA